jgi:hypothetical protein
MRHSAYIGDGHVCAPLSLAPPGYCPFFGLFDTEWTQQRLFKREQLNSAIGARVEERYDLSLLTHVKTIVKQVEPKTTLLFTIEVSAKYRGTQEIYSAQVIACNGEKLYHAAEALSISEAVEKIVQQMKLQEKHSGSFK